MDKTIYNFLFFYFKVVLSFFKSLNLSPPNSKSLRNSKLISCLGRRKETRKGVRNVTKYGKALLAKIREICGQN